MGKFCCKFHLKKAGSVYVQMMFSFEEPQVAILILVVFICMLTCRMEMKTPAPRQCVAVSMKPPVPAQGGLSNSRDPTLVQRH